MNNGDGTFADVAAIAGVAGSGNDIASGPLFFDANGDGLLDLFVGGVLGTPNRLFMANGDGTFTDRIASSGLPVMMETWSVSAGDYDRDGDLDLFLTHWGAPMGESHLWRNNGHGVFTCVDNPAGIHAIGDGQYDFSFTANFCDLNGDMRPDIVMTGDFGTSRVFMNNGDGTFADATGAVISDENGMGSAVGDFDNDGDMDWFVSSIYDSTQVPNGGNWGFSGNRMYKNRGDGSFDDATDACGVRRGGWGWGASFADFDNDGWLDLIHVNGWPRETPLFLDDATRLFMNDHQGSFVETAEDAGCATVAQGRGVVCFDYDNDGDIDVFEANFNGTPTLLRNDGANANNWLTLALHGNGHNPQAIGARVVVEAGVLTQTRALSCGNNYLSQNPAEIHVGLGNADYADVRIDWPDGASSSLTDVAAGQRLVVEEPRSAPSHATSGPLRIVSAAPTPFTTEVALEIAGATASMSAVVYDVAGRRVADVRFASGTLRWNGKTTAGVLAPAGVYWIRVSDGAHAATSRVVLVR
ncbi:MAG TPA: FG-GAP-like repeat-containing protein, partial [Candidatus Krumholzibacteria bacterium]|nr:FG-GAP-like repeat-containing protein [Candidatus Krumholzibacteria bacterium]